MCSLLLRRVVEFNDDASHVVAAQTLTLVQTRCAVLLKHHLDHTGQPLKFAFVPRFFHLLLL